MCFVIKLLNKKIKGTTSSNILFLLILKLLSISLEQVTELNQHLRDCPKKAFFTIETWPTLLTGLPAVHTNRKL